MSRSTIDQIKAFYRKGIYKLSQIDAMLAAGKITDEEYTYILGENA